MSGLTAKKVEMLVTNRGLDDPRVCMEAEALANEGFSLRVVGWDRDAERDGCCRRNGVEFRRLSLSSTHGRGIAQVLFLGGYWLRAWSQIRRCRPGVIHCHDLDTLPLGWLAARSFGARLVFDAHESFPDMMAGHLPALAVGLIRRLEKQFVPRCDLVITVGDRLAEHYRLMGAKEVVVVGNWKARGDFTFPAAEVAAARRRLGLREGVIAICFVANLGRERHLEPLLAAVAGDSRFACVIGGDGPQADMVKSHAARSDNIVYLGRVAPERVPLITAACDVVYYGFDETNPNARWSAPNKLYEAIAAARPVLAGDFGEIGDIVRTGGCGVIAATARPDSIRAALNELASAGTLGQMADRARGLQEHYSADRARGSLHKAYAALRIESHKYL